jgi:hypothetical protein
MRGGRNPAISTESRRYRLTSNGRRVDMRIVEASVSEGSSVSVCSVMQHRCLLTGSASLIGRGRVKTSDRPSFALNGTVCRTTLELVHCERRLYLQARQPLEEAVEAKDCFGRNVRIGDRIRIIGFSKKFMDTLPPEDRDQVSEMIGNVFEVEEIDEVGQAWVTMWWTSVDGETDAHGIGLAPSEMEFVGDGGPITSVAETC